MEAKILVLIAVLVWGIDLVFIFLTDNSWKNVGITWLLLSIGATLFGIALTI